MPTKSAVSKRSTQNLKMLPAPKDISSRSKPFNAALVTRLISALLFAILGFNLSISEFFYTYPLFGLRFLTPFLITLASALIGYFVLLDIAYQIKKWFELLIINTVVEIVSKFWELQSKKIQEQRRVKQKLRSDIEKEKSDAQLKTAVVVDTSVLIDGRILELVKLNFLEVPLIVPQEVVTELHTLSDSKDSLKRQKGRRGLDVVRELKKRAVVTVRDIKFGSGKDSDGVDKLLVLFCKAFVPRLLTLDFNLAKVAAVNGIKVLNINALANSLKTVLLPGEEVEIKIIQEGKEKQQGIGYLEDGTMLIVDEAKDKVGQNVKAVVSKVIQSPAGKIIFCKIQKA